MLSGKVDESMLNTLEEGMVVDFVNPLPGKNWREGTQKAYFNYLLLDPRVTQNLPVRARSMGGCYHSYHFSANANCNFYNSGYSILDYHLDSSFILL